MPRLVHLHTLTFPYRLGGDLVGSCFCGARFRVVEGGIRTRYRLVCRGTPRVYDDAYDRLPVEDARVRCAACGHRRDEHGSDDDGRVPCGAWDLGRCGCADYVAPWGVAA